MPRLERAKAGAAGASREQRAEVYSLIRSIVGKNISTDSFNSIVMNDLDKDIYVSTVNAVTKTKPTMKAIFRDYSKYNMMLYNERAKRYPSPSKAMEYKTKLLAYGDIIRYYGDIIEFIDIGRTLKEMGESFLNQGMK